MAKFAQNYSLVQFQQLIDEIYGLPDDRLFSVDDLLSNQVRFTMRALKGIRKGNSKKLEENLIIAFAWLVAIANRLHINLEKALWDRFPLLCSYCDHSPCICKKEKIIKRVKITRGSSKKPATLEDFQKMFDNIYPAKRRTLADAGVHLAEETGEVSEAVHIFQGKHQQGQFKVIETEVADWISCMFGVANSAKINISKALAKKFRNNCHVCHHSPCTCNFSFIGKFKS